MKRLAVVLIVVIFMIQSSFVLALAPLTLNEAKALTIENARSLQSLEITVEQLRLRASIAKDTYEAKDIYKQYNNAVNYLLYLNQEVAALEKQLQDPDLSGEEKESLGKELNYKLQMVAMERMTIGALKKQFPSNLGADSPLKKMWDEAKDQYEDLKVTYQQALKQMEVGIEKLFFGIYYQRLAVDVLEKGQQLQNLSKEIAIYSRDLGLGTTMEVQQAESELVETNKALADLRVSIKDVSWKLNDLMGRKVSTPLNLVVPLYTPEKIEKNYNEVLEACLINSPLIPQKERDLEKLRKEYRDTTDRKERAVIAAEIEKAEIDLVDAEQKVGERVKDVLDGLHAKYKAWQAAVYKKSEAELRERFAGYKYEQGLISRMEKLGSELALKQAVMDEARAKYDYFMLVSELELVEMGIVE